jgi:serine/threonine-protein phosphatase 2A catalytic subunit
MDTNMEDVGRVPTDVSPVQNEPATIPTLDGWIESLMKCKQLSEADVQRLCDKVSRSESTRTRRRCCW